MPRYHVHYEQVLTVGEAVVLPGEKPGDKRIIRSYFAMTAPNQRYVARHAFDGWIQSTDMSAPVLIEITIAPPKIS